MRLLSDDDDWPEWDESDEEIVGGGIPADELYVWLETLKGGGGLRASDFTDEDIAMLLLCRNLKLKEEKMRRLEEVFIKYLRRPRGERAKELREAIREFVDGLKPEDLERSSS